MAFLGIGLELTPKILQTWNIVPPNDTNYYSTYDTSLYYPNGGPGMLEHTTYNPASVNAFSESMPSIGVPIAYDLNSGNHIGVKHELSTLNAINQTRMSSYTAFWNSTVTLDQTSKQSHLPFRTRSCSRPSPIIIPIRPLTGFNMPHQSTAAGSVLSPMQTTRSSCLLESCKVLNYRYSPVTSLVTICDQSHSPPLSLALPRK